MAREWAVSVLLVACMIASLSTSQAQPALCNGSVEPRCGSTATCVDTAGGYKCQCPRGFYFVNATKACVDVNECAYQLCKGTARCLNTNGSFSCVCPAGFSYNGTTCVDNNECAALISPCKGNSICENTPGSYKCNCSKGYWYTGTGCADANECLQSWPGPCQGSGFCANTLGGYRCDCPNQPTKFYNATRGDCQDPCMPNPCGLGTCARALTSTGRKYTCSCPSTSVWNATTGTCNPVLRLSGTNVAQGKPVTCSSNPNQCTSAVDGSTSTGWMSYDMGGRICVNVTLGTSPISITKVNVSCAASSNGTASIAIQQSTGTTVWDYTTSGSPSLPIIVEGTQVWAYSFSQAYSAKSLKWCYSPYDWSASQFATMMVIYELRVIAA